MNRLNLSIENGASDFSYSAGGGERRDVEMINVLVFRGTLSASMIFSKLQQVG